MPGGSHRQELGLSSSRGALVCAAGLCAHAGAAAEPAVLPWGQLLCWRLYKMCIGIRDWLRLVSAVLTSGLPDVPLLGAGQGCVVARLLPGSPALAWPGVQRCTEV